MKRILSLILCACLMISAAAASADAVSDALSQAAAMTNEELYAKAQEEAAAGKTLNFYSTTSFAEKAAANFMAEYPGLTVRYFEIDDGETYNILTKTIGSGVNDYDMGLVQNGPDLKLYLLDSGLSYNYFPASFANEIPEDYRDPTVVTFINSLMIYHNGGGSIGLTNVWQLTEEAWKGKVFFKNPVNETVNVNFLIIQLHLYLRVQNSYGHRLRRAG